MSNCHVLRCVREHLHKRIGYLSCFGFIDGADFFDEAAFVHGAYLVEQDEALFVLQGELGAKNIIKPLACQRCDDDGA